MRNLLEAEDITKEFSIQQKSFLSKKSKLRAVSQLSLALQPKMTVGLVGESGSGKSTLGEILGGLQKPTTGHVYYEGHDLNKMTKQEMLKFRRNVQFIFQSPKESMNPIFTIEKILLEPLKRIEKKAFNKQQGLIQARNLLHKVGLDYSVLNKFPDQLSGGQCQRIAIARALLLNPKVIICDECVSALDVSVQAQILNLLKDLQQEFNTAYLFISHDMKAVHTMSDQILVMYRGEMVEEGLVEEVFHNPKHHYTMQLLESSGLLERQTKTCFAR